jgi:hypothetical protein
MKAIIHLYLDNYELPINRFKEADVKSILAALQEFLQKEKYSFEIQLTRYPDSVALGVPAEFISIYDKKKIDINPFGFHKNLKVMFEHVSNENFMCDCGDVFCDGHCGTLRCGCVDICHGYCGESYDSY